MDTPQSATILVVDDNPSKRYTTARVLRAAGFAVIEAATGQQTLELAQSGPDAIVLDVNLPDIDGFEVCRLLRARETDTRTPIIHLSATFVESGDKVHGLDAGADGYLTHPVEGPVLVATVNAFVRARHADESRRRSEDRFRAIFDLALNGIALFDADMRILQVNPAMARLLGTTADAAVAERWEHFLADDAGVRLAEMLATMDRDGQWSGTLVLRRGDGTRGEVEGSITTHSLPGVRVAVLHDITQRRDAERERERLHASERAARAEAERANRLKDEFLATVSHELRSPLQAILGWAQILTLRPPTELAQYRDAIEVIHRNARVQAQLIADLLDIARITSGKMTLELQAVDLAVVLRDAASSAHHHADSKGVSIACDLPAGPVVVRGDPGRLQQIVDNLLTNAIKFTPKHGRVTLRARADADATRIEVEDTGQGITGDFLPHIFETFRQEDAGTTRRHEGLGLGLAIVQRLVELHGGSVSADSAGTDRGATFTVTLPSAIGPDAELAPAAAEVLLDAAAKARLQGLRVLVVDDDADARGLMRSLLDEAGARPVVAESAYDAQALLEVSDPQLLISDISMPGMDGYALLAGLRRDGWTAERLPAIALTAFAMADDRTRVLASGFQAHVPKPIDVGHLLRTIVSLVRGPG